ncbi:MAG TPA: hypothetical protein VGN08_11040 [Solirubrobacteraceae bacterium]|jgi:hypothetical protein
MWTIGSPRALPHLSPRIGRLRALRRVTPGIAPLACALALGCPAASAAATSTPPHSGTTTGKPGLSATLVQCVTAVQQAERSATFSGEMTAISGSTHMEIRIDVLERLPEEVLFHTVSAPGLGIWRGSAPGVKVFKYLKQVTNLSAPAFYRAAVRFRWLNAHGRLIRSEELRTPRCQQPAVPPPPKPPATATAPATATPPATATAPAGG